MQKNSSGAADGHGALGKLPRGPRGEDHGDEWVAARRAAAEAAAGGALPHLAGLGVPNPSAAGNVESLVGWAQVPVGLAGPLRLSGGDGESEVYVPMATTEGALVASTSRGMSLIAAGGGAWARVTEEELSQHPVLVYGSAAEALAAARLAEASEARFMEMVAGITRHGALVRLETQVLGRRLLLRLLFTTGDAIGINMAAHGAEICSRDLAERTGALERFVHGQDVEKRANARALVEGRGRSVVAEAVVPREALAAKARTTPEALVRVLRTYAVGYAQLGTQNWTVQAANTIAAVFLACGQDVAYVTECATGILDFDVTKEGDLTASVTLPSMLVGTVGGGSGLGTAAECLRILGCEGAGRANRLAEIIAATVLAGDLSLMAAFASHEFVAAHEALGRNRPAGGGG
ncbi:MAG: 3-hydroxy-3-methylglutaryl-CoA reductase [Planctomycetota bacterium]